MSIIKKAEPPKPGGLDLKGLPDFSAPTGPINLAPAGTPAPTPAPTPAAGAPAPAPAKGVGINSFMPGAPAAAARPASTGGGLNAFMPGAPQQYSGGGGGVSPAYSAVKSMQKAILDFATAASATDVTSMDGNRNGKQTAGQNTEKPNPNFDPSRPEGLDNPKNLITSSEEYLAGSDPFGNFLVGQYLNQSDPVGHQYVNVDVAGNANREGYGAGDNLNLRGVIDTIKRIGTPGSQGTEKAVDGVWEVRTNNALKNIFALAYAMFHLSQEMSLDLPGLNQDVLDKFKALVPESYDKVPANEKAGIATQLTSIISDMSKVFGAFKKFVLNNRQYRSFIDQRKSFKKYTKPDTTPKNTLSDEDKKLMGPARYYPIKGVEVSGVKDKAKNHVSLGDLASLEDFKTMVKNMGFDPNNQQELQRVYKEVMAGLTGEKVQPSPGF